MGGGPSKEDLQRSKDDLADLQKEKTKKELEARILLENTKATASAELEKARTDAQRATLEAQHREQMAKQEALLKVAQMENEYMQKAMEAQLENERKMAEYEKKHQVEVLQMQHAVAELQRDLAKAEEKFMEDAADPDQYEDTQNQIFQQFCSNVEKLPEADKTSKPSVAVLGQNGVGKSSMINALCGSTVTRTGNTDTTKVVAKVFESDTTEYYDVPGCSEERSYANLKSILGIKTMHLILIVYIDRVEHILKLERLVRSCKVPYIVVRNKVDDMKTEDGLSQEESREQAYRVEVAKLSSDLCYVSAREGYGLDNLRTAANNKGVQL